MTPTHVDGNIDLHERWHILLHYQDELQALLDAQFIGCLDTPETRHAIQMYTEAFINKKMGQLGYGRP